jgi:hypothetical protein
MSGLATGSGAGLALGQGLQYQTAIGGPGLTAAYPTNTALPSITGTPQVGETLTVDPGTWVGAEPIVLTYQWYADGVALEGETGDTLVLGAETEGTLITVVETATAATGAQASAVSAAVGPVEPA